MAQDGIQFQFDLPDFKAQLEKLSLQVERQIVRSATFAAAKVFKEAVQAEAGKPKAPVKRARKGYEPGTLRRSIYAYRVRNPATGTVAMVVGFRKGKSQQKRHRDAFYGRFLERGWVPRGPGQKLKGGRRTRAVVRAREAKAGKRKFQYPFLRPAFRQARSAALLAFVFAMKAGIDRAKYR